MTSGMMLAGRRMGGTPTGWATSTFSAVFLLLLSAGGVTAQHPPPPDDPPPTVTSVEVHGLDRLDPRVRLPRRLPLRPGVPYTMDRVEAMDRVVVEAFAERGHPYVSVELEVERDVDAGTATVRLEVTDVGPEVRFGGIEVFTQAPIHEAVIRERIAYTPGDPYRPSQMGETRARLLPLPVVGQAIVVPLGLDARATVVTTIVSVAPVPRPREPELSGTLSSVRCVELRAFWRDRYFLDGPRFLELGAGAENLLAGPLGGRFPCSDVGEGEFADPGYFVSGEVRHPWPGSPLTTVTASLSAHRRSAPRAYVLRSAGARLDIRRVFGDEMVVVTAYAPERAEVRAADFFFCATFGACTRSEIETLQATRWLAPLELAAQWIPRRTREAVTPRPVIPGLPPPAVPRPDERPVDPRWRPRLYAKIQAAGRATGSDLSWGRFELEATAARFVGERGEIVIRGRAGAVRRGRGVLPPQLRFYGGGPRSVRGAEQNLLGPLLLVTTPAEASELGCVVAADGCPPGTVAGPDLVRPRPRGAARLVEANVEARVRVTTRTQLAAFVDHGFLRADDRLLAAPERSQPAEGATTPGIGVRVETPIGLVRLDAGYDSRSSQSLPLLSPDADGRELLLLGDVLWDPHGYDDPGTVSRFLRRIRLGLAIGQPF